MAISSFNAPGTKKLISTSHNKNKNFVNKYGDPFSIDGKTWSVDHNTKWYVDQSVKLSGISLKQFVDRLWKIVNGDNFNNKVEYYQFNNGFFYSDEMRAKGVFPINHINTGTDGNMFKRHTLRTGITIGRYVYNSLFEVHLDGNDQHSTPKIMKPGDFYTVYKDLSNPNGLTPINSVQEIVELDKETIKKVFNYGDTSYKDGIYINELFDSSNGNLVQMVSSTPIYFVNGDANFNDVKSEKSFFIFDPVTTKVKDNIEVYPVSASKIFVINPIVKLDSESLTNDMLNLAWEESGTSRITNMVPCCLLTYCENNSFLYYTNIVRKNEDRLFRYNFTIGNIITDVNMNDVVTAYYDTVIKGMGTNVVRFSSFYEMLNRLKTDTNFLPEEKRLKHIKVLERVLKFASLIHPDPNKLALAYNTKPGDDSQTLIPSNYLNDTYYCEIGKDPNTGLVNHYLWDASGTDIIRQIPILTWTGTSSKPYGYLGGLSGSGEYYGFRMARPSNLLINRPVKDNPDMSSINLVSKIKTLVDGDFLYEINKTSSFNWPYKSQTAVVNEYSFERLFNPAQAPLFKSLPIESRHFEDIRKANDDIIMSDQIDDLLDINSYTDDYFVSKFLVNDEAKDQEYLKHLDSIKNLNPKQVIMNGINKNITKSEYKQIPIDQLEQIINQVNEKNKERPNVDSIKHKKYNDYKLLFFSLNQDETKTGMVGHNRILETNSNESPHYRAFIEAGFSDSEIKGFATTLFDEFDSVFNTSSRSIVDTLDVTNEINIINSMVSSQLGELTNAVSEVSNKINKVDSSDNQALKSIYDDISNIFSATGAVSQSISQTTNSLNQSSNDFISNNPTAYDAILLKRNTENATKYVSSLLVALADDPYKALSQHSAYLKTRASKISIKSSVIDKVLQGGDFLIKLPSMTLSGLFSASKLVLALINVAFAAAVESITILDNIDKIVFISEQFVSKGVSRYATIPTVYDDMFEPPGISPSDYINIKRSMSLKINMSIDINKQVKEFLANTKTNPVEIDGKVWRWNNYDVDDVVGNTTGYYYPINKDLIGKLPIIKVISSDTIELLPDLTDHVLKYPHRGNMWHSYIKQINYFFQDAKVDNLSPFIPVTTAIEASYVGFIFLAATVAGGAAMLSAGLKGDWLGALIGGAVAVSAVFAANTAEMVNIVAKRTRITSQDSVYTYFQANYDKYTSELPGLITQQFIDANYVYVNTEQDIPLFSDASDFKKFFITVKESIMLIGNIAVMGFASFMIGKVAASIARWAGNKKLRKSLKNVYKYENEAFKKDKETGLQDINKRKEEVNNDNSLSQEEKDIRLEELSKDEKNLIDYYDGKVNLNPTNKNRLNGILASNWGTSSIVSSSSASTVAKLAEVGPLTSKAMEDFTSSFNDFFKDNSQLSDLNNNASSLNQGSLVEATSGLMKLLLETKDNTEIVKKYA